MLQLDSRQLNFLKHVTPKALCFPGTLSVTWACSSSSLTLHTAFFLQAYLSISFTFSLLPLSSITSAPSALYNPELPPISTADAITKATLSLLILLHFCFQKCRQKKTLQKKAFIQPNAITLQSSLELLTQRVSRKGSLM